MEILVNAKTAVPKSDAEYSSWKNFSDSLKAPEAVVTHLADGARLTDIHEMLAEASTYREDDAGCLE